MKKILLVDDIDIMNTLFKMCFSSCGVKADYLIAKNGRDGFDMFANNSISLVIMDHYMPIMDGVEALIKMRHIDKFTPIYMSSSDCALCEKKCLAYGATGILPKPVSPRLLLDSVIKHLQ